MTAARAGVDIDVLQNPIWHALTGRQAHLAQGDGHAVRFRSDYAAFAAVPHVSADTLCALGGLIRPGAPIWTLGPGDPALPPGTSIMRQALCLQMVARAITPGVPMPDIVPLGAVDAAAMFALATLTEPGPFFANTHRFGGFIGVKIDGYLVAMAGERMKPGHFSEVSGVCTHPDHRGRGYAAALMRRVAQNILDRGEAPFLHVYADNAGAIALYEALGFAVHGPIMATIIGRD